MAQAHAFAQCVRPGAALCKASAWNPWRDFIGEPAQYTHTIAFDAPLARKTPRRRYPDAVSESGRLRGSGPGMAGVKKCDFVLRRSSRTGSTPGRPILP